MAADLEDRNRLAGNATFTERVTGAVLVTANAVGIETIGSGNVTRFARRTALISQVLRDPAEVGAQFARAAAGSTLASTFADAATAAPGDQAAKDVVGVNAVSDAAIQTYVSGAWDVIAGVQPTERA